MVRALIAGLALFTSLAVQSAEPGTDLSPRARELLKLMKTQPQVWDALDDRCHKRMNWQTPDCVARGEIARFLFATDHLRREPERKLLREQCDAGDQEKCIKLACTTEVGHHIGTPAEMTACARAKGLAVAATWAQTYEVRNDHEHRFNYVCLEPMHLLDPYGVKVAKLASETVRSRGTDKSGAQVYEAESIQERTFATKEAAATAGCVATRPQHIELAKSLGFTPIE